MRTYDPAPRQNWRTRRAFAATAAAALLAASAACSTQRSLVLESDPPGARVWVNGVDHGPSPVVVPFTHYGRWDVRMEHPGYRSLATSVVVPTAIDGYPIVDLPAEMIVRERRFTWRGRLEPILRAPTDADLRGVLERAREFRARTHREVAEPGTPGPMDR